MNKNKTILLAIIIVLAIAVGVLAYMYFNKNTADQNVNAIVNVPSIEEQRQKIADILAKAGTMDFCNHFKEIADEEQFKDCVQALATNNKDVALCSQITDAMQSDMCVFNVAYKAKDVKMCDSIKDAGIKDSCAQTIK